VAKDLEKPIEDFFNNEGSSLLSGLARIVFTPFLKKMQGEN
jgi:hypothetical protein